MRILILTHAFNSLAQRLFVELVERGHDVSVELDIQPDVTVEAVRLHRADLVLAPFLKRAIPETVWRRLPCLVVHPGPPGDRGPSALDWAILDGAAAWGVTVLQAESEMDAGPIWSSARVRTRACAKSSLYRNELTEAAVVAVLEAIARLARGASPPAASPAGAYRRRTRPADRAIDWQRHTTVEILRRIRSADGRPGVRDEVLGASVMLYDAHEEDRLRAEPGAVLARRGGAICRATTDGAVWLGHLRRREGEPGAKLPATTVLADRLDAVPEVEPHDGRTYRDLWYVEKDGVGHLHFPFYNGAMSADQCDRLRAALVAAKRRDTRVITLMGGPDFWSNGIHLGVIEEAASPADESWRNILAMDDLARELLRTERQITIAALQGNAGAGGVFLALGADRVLARTGVVLNPHYRGMGNLYGSEYWTYVLPRRIGCERAAVIADARLPMGTAEALRLGLVDARFGDDVPSFRAGVVEMAEALARDRSLPRLLEEKQRRRVADEAAKPLERYREEELERMKLNFYGFDPSYHIARYNFIRQVAKSRTPSFLARHRHARTGREP